MRQRETDGGQLQDHDSFLDIVANMVGILIILVMVVGLKAKDAGLAGQSPPPAAETVPFPQTAEELALLRREAVSLEREVLEFDGESRRMFDTIGRRRQERDYLAARLAAAEAALAAGDDELDQRQRAAYEARLALRRTLDELEQTSEQLAALELMPRQVTRVESLPTPLGRTVHGREVHFQLLGGRLARVPVEELFEEAKREAREKVWKLEHDLEATELVGPRDGFRMRYTLEKVEMPLEQRRETGRGGYVIRSKQWELIPMSSRLGEPYDEAVAAGGLLQQALSRLDPNEVTITVWTYPDSFPQFRLLKQELHRRGFAAAGRPLPAGVSIGGSPHGTRSSAQ